MRTHGVVIAILAAAGVCWTAVSAQQEPTKVPGFGTGIVTVSGTVDIGNVPSVLAIQAGEWKMAVSSVPDVRVVSAPAVSVTAPEFLKVKGKYEVTWAAGEREAVEVAQLGAGGWARVETTKGRQRWVNLAAARSVEIVP